MGAPGLGIESLDGDGLVVTAKCSRAADRVLGACQERGQYGEEPEWLDRSVQ